MSLPASPPGRSTTLAPCRDWFARSVAAHQRYLIAVARKHLDARLRSKCDPVDLVQETFLRAHRHLERFRGGGPAQLRAWLRTILLRLILNLRRHYQVGSKRCAWIELPLDAIPPAETPPSLLEEATPPRNVERREELDRLGATLVQLKWEYREVILLRVLDARTFEEIGARLDRTPDGARMLWNRAVEALHRRLNPVAASRQ